METLGLLGKTGIRSCLESEEFLNTVISKANQIQTSSVYCLALSCLQYIPFDSIMVSIKNANPTMLEFLKNSLKNDDKAIQNASCLILHRTMASCDSIEIGVLLIGLHSYGLDRAILDQVMAFALLDERDTELAQALFEIMSIMLQQQETKKIIESCYDYVSSAMKESFRVLRSTLARSRQVQCTAKAVLHFVHSMIVASTKTETIAQWRITEPVHVLVQKLEKDIYVSPATLNELHTILLLEKHQERQLLNAVEQRASEFELKADESRCNDMKHILDIAIKSVVNFGVNECCEIHARLCSQKSLSSECVIMWFSALEHCSQSAPNKIEPQLLARNIIWALELSGTSCSQLLAATQQFLDTILCNHSVTKSFPFQRKASASLIHLHLRTYGSTKIAQEKTLAALYLARINGASLPTGIMDALNKFAKSFASSDGNLLSPFGISMLASLDVDRREMEDIVFSYALKNEQLINHWFSFCSNEPPPPLFLDWISKSESLIQLFEQALINWVDEFLQIMRVEDHLQWIHEIQSGSVYLMLRILSIVLQQEAKHCYQRHWMNTIMKTALENNMLGIQTLAELLEQVFHGDKEQLQILQTMLIQMPNLPPRTCNGLILKLCNCSPSLITVTCLNFAFAVVERYHRILSNDLVRTVAQYFSKAIDHAVANRNVTIDSNCIVLCLLWLNSHSKHKLPDIAVLGDLLSVSYKQKNALASKVCIECIVTQLGEAKQTAPQMIQSLLLQGLFSSDESCQIAAADAAIYLRPTISCQDNLWNIAFFETFVNGTRNGVSPPLGWLIYMISFFTEKPEPKWLKSMAPPEGCTEFLVKTAQARITNGQVDEETIAQCVLIFCLGKHYPGKINQYIMQVFTSSVRTMLESSGKKKKTSAFCSPRRPEVYQISTLDVDIFIPADAFKNRCGYDINTMIYFLEQAIREDY